MKKYQILSNTIIEKLIPQSQKTPRKRINYNYHQLGDKVQRFLNIANPESYIRPHKHQNPDKTETFLVLKGTIKFFVFDDSGSITDCFNLSAHSDNYGIDILPGTWHSFVAISKPAVTFEVKEGPYIKETDKTFAEFAPAEESRESQQYLKYLKNYPL